MLSTQKRTFGEYLKFVRLAWMEARPVVQLIFMLRFSVGALLTADGVDSLLRPSTGLAMLAWLAVTWAVYLLNGVADIAEDRGNASTRPIARGHLPVDVAMGVVRVLAAFALVAAAAVSLAMLVLVVLMFAVGWAYSMGPYPLKRNMVGFLLSVCALGLLTYLAGWCAASGGTPDTSLLLFGPAMSVWMGTVGATKDLSDVRGDRLAGRRTPPLVLGEGPARALIAVMAGLVGCSFLVLAAIWDQPLLLPAAAVVCLGAGVLAVAVLTPFSQGDRQRRRRPYRIFMLTQYGAHATLLL
jgi:4-hydroxybenzoate polyprenyltransferase